MLALQLFNLGSPEALYLLLALVPLAVLLGWDLNRRQRVLRLFVSQSLLDDVSPRRSIARPIFKFAVLSVGLASLVFALARPRWNPHQIELERPGQNLLFCLDVSNSMRATDVDPSRFEAAKAAIRSMVDALPAGHQVGLLAYAGRAEVKCPLTPNYQHMLSVLDRVTYNSTTAGGSNLAAAVYMAAREVFGLDIDSHREQDENQAETSEPADRTKIKKEQAEAVKNANVLIVLTDGESHEGHARKMVHDAYNLGAAIYIIGLGTEEGAPIPIEVNGKTTYAEYKDEQVITRFDDAALTHVIEGLPQERCGYLRAGKENVDLLDVYNRVISEQVTSQRKLSLTVWQEKFQLFAGIGMVLVLLASVISGQRPAAGQIQGSLR